MNLLPWRLRIETRACELKVGIFGKKEKWAYGTARGGRCYSFPVIKIQKTIQILVFTALSANKLGKAKFSHFSLVKCEEYKKSFVFGSIILLLTGANTMQQKLRILLPQKSGFLCQYRASRLTKQSRFSDPFFPPPLSSSNDTIVLLTYHNWKNTKNPERKIIGLDCTDPVLERLGLIAANSGDEHEV